MFSRRSFLALKDAVLAVGPIHRATSAAIDLTANNSLDALEPRRMLANDPLTVGTFKVGTAVWLNVVGTANDDAIVVTQTSKTAFRIANGSWSVTKTGSFVGVRVLAGLGNDTVTVAGTWATRTSLLGEAGDDTIVGGVGGDYVLAGVGNDSVAGNAGVDTLYGEAGDDVLAGGAGNDFLHGGAGNDNLDGGADNDNLNGIDGNDTLAGGTGNDLMNGGIGADSLLGNDGNDNMLGVDGNDTLVGGAGNDSMNGGVGDDSLDGVDGNDTLIGDLGNDTLLGGAGADWLGGYAGNDSVDGGDGGDKIVATTDSGNDIYVGGTGLDTLDYTGRKAALTITLDAQANDGATGETDTVAADFEILIGGDLNDSITSDDTARALYGGLGNDTLTGGAAADKLYGGAGNDSLVGGAGADSLWGQADNDVLVGGDDADMLEGGAGNDRYDGGAGSDRLIAIGGGNRDSLTGGADLDSFWLDSDITETITDVDAGETAAKAVHRVKAFVNYGKTVISKELTGQNLAEPVGTGKLINFKANKLFADAGPNADDIQQGQTGDCWYLSSLASIADTQAEVLRQSITDLGDGTYAARFYNPANGAEQYVRVDADLYTYTWSATTPMYQRLGAQSSIWAPLLEKALTWVRGSKLGNYATISGGWMNEAYARFGMTSTANWKGSSFNNASAMVDWIQDQLDAGKAVTAGFITITGNVNLVGSHAYTVDRVVDNGDGTYNVVLRNPWGSDGNRCDDGHNDGYVSLTSAQLFSNYYAIMSGMAA